jgi:hypothetical protein
VIRLVHLLLACALLVCGASIAVPDAQAQYFRFGKNKIQYQTLDWRYLQSTHFDVFYYEPGGEALAQFTARAAEEAYADIQHLFDYRITDRIAILVYQNHNEFAVTNAADLPAFADGIGGFTELFKNRVALPFMGDYREYRRILHHEIVHAVVNDMFYGGSLQRIIQSGTRLRLPLWFGEGIAEYSAMGWDSHSDMYLREAVLADRIRSVSLLRGYFAYRGGQGFFDFIAAQYGREKITEILHRVKGGRSVDAAFERALGLDLDALSERWVQAMRGAYLPEVAAREELNAIARPLVTGETGGRFNTGAAMSPRGDFVAYLSASGPLFDVYVVETTGDARPRRLIAGQTSPEFESFRVLTPSLSWNPGGTRLALAVKSGPSDAIALVDVNTQHTHHYRIPEVDGISSVRWSPDGGHLAFSATSRGQSDIYLLDLTTEEVSNLTNDIFSDLEPTWAPDGRSIVFHSDRGDHVEPGTHTSGAFDMNEHDFAQFSLYRIDLDERSLERLTNSADWDDQSPAFGADPHRLLFVSDRNGVFNLYELDLTSGEIRPLTDLFTGISQVSLSADGRSAALIALKDGSPSVFLLRDPFDRQPAAPLAPTIWASRVMGDTLEQKAPALVVAHATTLQENPFLREAAGDLPFLADIMRRKRLPEVVAARLDEARDTPDPDEGADRADSLSASAADSIGLTHGRVDYRTHDLSGAFDEAQEENAGPADRRAARFAPQDNLQEDGSFRPKRYRIRFSPDLIFGNLGYEAVFGVQSVTQMSFSDLLGNHRITAATNLVIDLRNSDYLLSYQYLPHRTDYRVAGFHLARQLTDFTQQRYFRYRNYGLAGSATYPLDKFRRVEAEISVQGTSLTNLMEPTLRSRTRVFFYPSLTYTVDGTVPGFLSPSGGHRLAVRVAGSPGLSVTFATLLADARQYFGNRYYTVALRAAGGAAIGPDPPRFFAAGVQNWINPGVEGIPIRDENDFVFGTPILPLRGHAYDSASGDHFAMVNAEARFPLVAALLPGPLPVLPLYNLQGVAFVDAAAIPGESFSLWTDRDDDGNRVLEDLYIGAGVGFRTLVLGYPVRFDWGWPFTGREFGDSRFYLSIGLDF